MSVPLALPDSGRTQEALALHLVGLIVLMGAGVHLGLVVKLGAVHAAGCGRIELLVRFVRSKGDRFQMLERFQKMVLA